MSGLRMLVVEVDRLKIKRAQLRRSQYGRSSEKLVAEIRQVELALDALPGATCVEPDGL